MLTRYDTFNKRKFCKNSESVQIFKPFNQDLLAHSKFKLWLRLFEVNLNTWIWLNGLFVKSTKSWLNGSVAFRGSPILIWILTKFSFYKTSTIAIQFQNDINILVPLPALSYSNSLEQKPKKLIQNFIIIYSIAFVVLFVLFFLYNTGRAILQIFVIIKIRKELHVQKFNME